MNRTLACLILVTIPVVTIAADIYRWTDPDGQVHFSDRPPPGDAVQLELDAPDRSPDPKDAGLRAGERNALRAIERRERRDETTRRRERRQAQTGGRAAERLRHRCEALDARIRNLRARQRAGYAPAEGVRLDDRLRRDRDQFQRDCR